MRQSILREYDPRPGTSIATLAYDYPAGYRVPEHAHGAGQVIYATSGVMEIGAGRSVWLIPPRFAVWVPARTRHRIRMPGAVSMRTLYLQRGLAAGLPDACAVLHVGALLRELIVEAVRIGELRARNRLHCALRDLLLAHLEGASPVETSVTLPRDFRALAVAHALMADPAGHPPLATLSARAGASVRTVERLFRRDVGCDVQTWRRQLRLMKAMELLVAGRLVKQVAAEVGYQQPSAFVEVFRQTFGTTPKAWASRLG